MPAPHATIVIPCFNYGRFVGEAAASALRQRDADVDVVIVNDGSDDGESPQACQACAGDRVRVIHQENRGLPAARNAGARLARGEFVAFLDADDWIEPQFVARLAAALAAAGPDASHAYCQERLVELGTGIWAVPDWDPVLMMITNLHPVTALVKRDRFERVGGFDESMREGYEDWDLWLKFVEQGWRGVRVREPLFVWRRHSHSTMITQAVPRHEQLFRRLKDNHRDLYRRHADMLIERMNGLLRRLDANWLDEDLDAIPLRDTRRALDAAARRVQELEGAEARAADLAARLDAARRELLLMRAEYESMAAVRLHHGLHRLVGALPRPLAAASRRAMQTLKRMMLGGAPAARGATPGVPTSGPDHSAAPGAAPAPPDR